MPYDLVAIGASWGGLRALSHILPVFPEDFPAAIVVVLHRHVDSPRDAMAGVLATSSVLPVSDIEDKDPIEPGRVYLAPADYHLIVEPGHFALSTEELVDFTRPSVDVLFETAADSYGSSLVAVVLTGLNADGSRGLAAVKRRGGHVIVQHPDSAERSGMPAAAIATGLVDQVIVLGDIGHALTQMVAGPVRGSRQ